MEKDPLTMSYEAFNEYKKRPPRTTVMLGLYEGDIYKTRAKQFKLPLNTFCRTLMQIGLKEVELNGLPSHVIIKSSEEPEDFDPRARTRRSRRYWTNLKNQSAFSKVANKMVEPHETIFFWQYNNGDTEYITSTTEEYWYEKIPRPMAKKFVTVTY